MTNLTSIELIRIAMPLIIIQSFLKVFCLLKLSKDTTKYLPKWLWAIIVILGELLGPIVYLLLGREKE